MDRRRVCETGLMVSAGWNAALTERGRTRLPGLRIGVTALHPPSGAPSTRLSSSLRSAVVREKNARALFPPLTPLARNSRSSERVRFLAPRRPPTPRAPSSSNPRNLPLANGNAGRAASTNRVAASIPHRAHLDARNASSLPPPPGVAASTSQTRPIPHAPELSLVYRRTSTCRFTCMQPIAVGD